MKRKIRENCEDLYDIDLDFKQEVIKDILYQIDYQTALRQKVVTVTQENMVEELHKLPTSVLLAWYFAYLHIRSELMHAGYELNGLKVLDIPNDAIRDRMQKDPDFDLRQYIF